MQSNTISEVVVEEKESIVCACVFCCCLKICKHYKQGKSNRSTLLRNHTPPFDSSSLLWENITTACSVFSEKCKGRRRKRDGNSSLMGFVVVKLKATKFIIEKRLCSRMIVYCV